MVCQFVPLWWATASHHPCSWAETPPQHHITIFNFIVNLCQCCCHSLWKILQHVTTDCMINCFGFSLLCLIVPMTNRHMPYNLLLLRYYSWCWSHEWPRHASVWGNRNTASQLPTLLTYKYDVPWYDVPCLKELLLSSKTSYEATKHKSRSACHKWGKLLLLRTTLRVKCITSCVTERLVHC